LSKVAKNTEITPNVKLSHQYDKSSQSIFAIVRNDIARLPEYKYPVSFQDISDSIHKSNITPNKPNLKNPYVSTVKINQEYDKSSPPC